MQTPAWRRRFFTSTQGRIVSLLRRSRHTTNELAEMLRLSDNAVRVHLAALERDGLVQQDGTRRSVRRPIHIYRLTADAEQMFPRAYSPLLYQMLAVLKARSSPEELESILLEVGRRAAAQECAFAPNAPLEQRLPQAVSLLEEWGGVAEVEESEGRLLICGYNCPAAALVEAHPEACRLIEIVLSEMLGVPVKELCQNTASPRCQFEIMRVQGPALTEE